MGEDIRDRRRPAHFPGQEAGNRSTLFFVTVCTHDRRPVLANAAGHAALLDAWAKARWCYVGRYVIMPDHVHLFCAPAAHPPESLARWVACWKSIVARNWPDAGIEKLWQRDFWDTQLRRGDSYSAKWEYVRSNPVRAGLVAMSEEWPYQGEVRQFMWHD